MDTVERIQRELGVVELRKLEGVGQLLLHRQQEARVQRAVHVEEVTEVRYLGVALEELQPLELHVAGVQECVLPVAPAKLEPATHHLGVEELRALDPLRPALPVQPLVEVELLEVEVVQFVSQSLR